MPNEPLAQLFWRALDRLDYWMILVRLWIVVRFTAHFPTPD